MRRWIGQVRALLFAQNEGALLVEYCLLLLLIALVSVALVALLGQQVLALYNLANAI